MKNAQQPIVNTMHKGQTWQLGQVLWYVINVARVGGRWNSRRVAFLLTLDGSQRCTVNQPQDARWTLTTRQDSAPVMLLSEQERLMGKGLGDD